jgi:hypothetical protein
MRASAQPIDTLDADAQRLDDGATLRIDGILDEPSWRLVQPITGLRQREPNAGEPATERTELRVLFDGEYLYFGVEAYDSRPDAVIGRTLLRNQIMRSDGGGQPVFGGDDTVAILLDPFHDHRNGVIFATNCKGAKADALLTDEGRELNTDWRGVWDVAATRTQDGWSAEFAIPFRSLRFPEGGGKPWGLNIIRTIRRKNEEVLWGGWTRENGGFHKVSLAGHLQQLTELPRPGMNLELRPYALTGWVTQDTDDADESLGPLEDRALMDVGLDLKYEVRPGLVLDATLHPDFAQVEADQEQVNLTRFSLFFPEKREFFLENAGIFEFGFRGFGGPPPFLLFFSRQIGIAADDGIVPVVGGTRVTGRVGGQTIGFMNTVTEAEFEEPVTSFTVGRVKRDIGSNNYVGVIATDRRNEGTYNSSFGVDFSAWPTHGLNLQGFAARTQTRGDGGDDEAYRAVADFTGDHLGFLASYLAIGPDCDAQTGFITRTDIQRTDLFLRLTPRPDVLGLRRVDIYNSGQYVSRIDGEKQDWNAGPSVQLTFDSGEVVGASWEESFSRLDESFELTDAVEIPAGDFPMGKIGFYGNSASSRSFHVGWNLFHQDFFGGEFDHISGNLGLHPNPNLAVHLSAERNEVDVPQGAFRATVLTLRADYAFSTRLFLNSLLQRNNLDDRFSANIRIQYIHRPGSEIYLVYNETREDQGGRLALADRSGAIKLSYLRRI